MTQILDIYRDHDAAVGPGVVGEHTLYKQACSVLLIGTYVFICLWRRLSWILGSGGRNEQCDRETD